MFHAPHQYRWKNHPYLPSDDSFGNAGIFLIPHERIKDHKYMVMCSGGLGWEHVSVSIFKENCKQTRCCNWEEMCYIKNLFWDDSDCCVQYHPSKDQYVNVHDFVLHIWRPTNFNFPIPPKEMVG